MTVLSFLCPLATSVSYYILSSGRSSFQSHAQLTDELQTWQLAPLCLLTEFSPCTCAGSQKTWEEKNIWSTSSIKCWGGKEGPPVCGGAWFLLFRNSESVELPLLPKPPPGNAPWLIRKRENKASQTKAGLVVWKASDGKAPDAKQKWKR